MSIKSNKKNMLFPMVVPPSSGGGQNSTVTLNAGNMENKGVNYHSLIEIKFMG